MTTRDVKLEEMLTILINENGYSRNRQPILESVGITASALSQYARGHTKPSFDKLVSLANFFDVTLDYLVYGVLNSAREDHSPAGVAKYVQQALHEARSLTSRHHDLMGRIGRLLADRIDEVAKDLAESRTAGMEGLIEQEEALRIERYCRRADIVATDLSPNIITMAGGETVPGQFFQVVANNVANGCRYRFLLSARLATQSDSVTRFRDMLRDAVGGDHVNEYCAFRQTIIPVVGGAGLYKLDTARLAIDDPATFTQFSKYLLDGEWLGYLNRPNVESNADMLMSPDYAEYAQATFEALWGAATTRV